jgi:hypothetical protein
MPDYRALYGASACTRESIGAELRNRLNKCHRNVGADISVVALNKTTLLQEFNCKGNALLRLLDLK